MTVEQLEHRAAGIDETAGELRKLPKMGTPLANALQKMRPSPFGLRRCHTAPEQ